MGTHGFIKLMRSKGTAELLKKPKAFVLLTLIACRAKRTDEFSVERVAIGEALIGDWSAYGLTEQEYRTAKKQLEQWQLATFRATNKGTIAKLLGKQIFDINEVGSNDQPNTSATKKQRSSNTSATTNKKVKNERSERKTKEERRRKKKKISV